MYAVTSTNNISRDLVTYTHRHMPKMTFIGDFSAL